MFDASWISRIQSVTKYIVTYKVWQPLLCNVAAGIPTRIGNHKSLQNVVPGNSQEILPGIVMLCIRYTEKPTAVQENSYTWNPTAHSARTHTLWTLLELRTSFYKHTLYELVRQQYNKETSEILRCE